MTDTAFFIIIDTREYFFNTLHPSSILKTHCLSGDSMKILSISGTLTTREVESKLSKALELTESNQLTAINLTRLDWVELNAVHRFALFIEHLKCQGRIIEIWMPHRNQTIADGKKIQQAQSDVEKTLLEIGIARRKKVLAFLIYLRFPEVVRCQHIQTGKVDLLWEFDPDAPAENQNRSLQAPKDIKSTDSYHRIYPLRWLKYDQASNNQEDIEKTNQWLRQVLSHRDSRLTFEDTEALLRIALNEFLENVANHANHPTGHALYTLWIRQTQTYRQQRNQSASDDEAIEELSNQPEENKKITKKPYDPDEQSYLNQWEYSGEPSRELIEMHFGDSGDGIVATLTGAYQDDPQSDQNIPDKAKNLSQRVLFYALNRWSSSVDRSHKRGTRGLYRIRRLAMGYEGMITVVSDKHKVAYSYQHQNEVACEPKSKRKIMSPGTSISLRLMAPKKESTPKYPSEPFSKTPPPPDFRFESLSISTKKDGKVKDLEDTQKDQLRDLLRHQQHQVLVCFVPKIPDITQQKQTVENLLFNAALLSHPNAMVLILPFISKTLLGEYIHAVNQEIDRRRQKWEYSPDVYDPIMVMDRELSSHWVGGTQDVRKMLRHMGQFQEWIPLSNLTAFRSELLQQHWLFAFEEDRFCIRFNGPVIQQELGRTIEHRINHALEMQEKVQPGLHTGQFITPSLWKSKLWLDIGSFFSNLCWYDNAQGMQTTARATAENDIKEVDRDDKQLRHVKQLALHSELPIELLVFQLIGKLRQDTSVLQGQELKYMICESTDSAAVNAFEKYLGVEPIVIQRLDSPGIYENVWGYLKDKPVIVFADIVFTANSAKKILFELQKHGAQPLAVVCFLDDRKEKEQGSLIDTYQIPVISLAKAGNTFGHQDDLGEFDFSSFTFIEPQTFSQNRRARSEAPKQLTYPIDDENLRQSIEASNSLVLNHIHRHGARHFNFYMNIERLMQGGSGKVFIEKMAAILEDWVNQQATNTPPKELHIYYPEASGSEWAKHIAERLKEHLPESLFKSSLKPVLRPENRSKFIYHSHEELQNTLALVVDWGVVTGDTLSRIIRHLAERHAKAILCMVVLSSMPTYEEELLTSMAEIYRDRDGQTKVPVRWVPLCRFPIKAYQTHNCPICRIQDTYQSLKEHITTPEIVESLNHSTHKLEPKTRNRFFSIHKGEDSQRDNFDTQLSEDQIFEMVLLLQEIEDASWQTHLRLNFFNRWMSLFEKAKQEQGQSDQPYTAKCALLLCALANTKLKLEENALLRLEKIRKLLAKIAWLVLQNSHHNFHITAITMLSTSSASLFCQHFEALLTNYRRNTRLLLQLLVEVHLILQRQVTARKEIIESIEQAVETLLDRIEDEQKQGESSPDFLKRALKELRMKCLRRKPQDPHTPTDLRMAVSQIKLNFAEHIKPHRAITNLTKVLWEGVEELEAEGLAAKDPDYRYKGAVSWSKKLEYWYDCLDFLERALITHVRVARPIIFAEYYRGMIFNEEDILQLEQLLNQRKSDTLQRFTHSLQRFTRQAPLVQSSDWSVFKRDRDWIDKMFLQYATEDMLPAKLYQVVKDIPCKPIQVVQEIAAKWQKKGTIQLNAPESGSKVFLPERLLYTILNDIFENALITHKVPDESATMEVILEEQREHCHLAVRNTGSDPKVNNVPSNKQGLESAKRHLKTFDSQLDWHFNKVQQQFEVSLTLPFWREG
jgi:orotate phosphoribosyltransferase-like protein